MIVSYKPYIKNDTYTADFETLSGDVEETWVWAWSLCSIQDIDTCEYGNSIETFIDAISHKGNITIWMHNLSHDGKFLLYWLFRNGAQYKEKFDESKKMQFNCLIGDDGSFFNIKIKLRKRVVITFKDSLKKVNAKLSKIAEDWHTKYKKLDLDYIEYHEPGEELTQQIIDYVCNDSRILAEVIKTLYDMGFTGQTISSDSQTLYRQMYPFWYMDTPALKAEEDTFVRKAYRGGWCYLNPVFQGKDIDDGVIYDINSSYPSVMADENKLYPVGKGHYFEGKYDKGSGYVYVCHIKAWLELKDGCFPGLSKKRPYSTHEIPVIDTDGLEDFYLTSVDMQILEECYDIIDIHYIDGYYYKVKSGKWYFGDFITQLYQGKCTSVGAKRQTYKILMNGSYGKYGQKLTFIKKVPEYHDDVITYKKVECKKTESKGYVPMAAFITAYGRQKVISIANQNSDRFIYCDTDSIHLIGRDICKGIEIDKKALGKWDDEFYFTKGRYIKQKTYMLLSDDNVKLCCAGMSDDCKDIIKKHKEEYFKKFTPGLTIEKANLKSHQIKGGVTLIPEDFTLKAV